jgi:hypothetical protein
MKKKTKAIIIVFDKRLGDWKVWKRFDTKKQAEKFVEDYPLFLGDYSREIREGNWQITLEKDE